MRKLIVILNLVLIFSVAGGLYNTLAQLNDGGTVSMEEVFTPQFPEQLPHLILDPMVIYPVY